MMKEILEFLNKAGVYYLATADGDQPHVRPIGFVMDCGGKLAFCTSNQKAMYRQMTANPKVEISCCDGAGNTLRISGRAEFITCRETQMQALEVMPGLAGMYSADDGVFEIFCLEDAKAVCYEMSGKCTELTI